MPAWGQTLPPATARPGGVSGGNKPRKAGRSQSHPSPGHPTEQPWHASPPACPASSCSCITPRPHGASGVSCRRRKWTLAVALPGRSRTRRGVWRSWCCLRPPRRAAAIDAPSYHPAECAQATGSGTLGGRACPRRSVCQRCLALAMGTLPCTAGTRTRPCWLHGAPGHSGLGCCLAALAAAPRESAAFAHCPPAPAGRQCQPSRDSGSATGQSTAQRGVAAPSQPPGCSAWGQREEGGVTPAQNLLARGFLFPGGTSVLPLSAPQRGGLALLGRPSVGIPSRSSWPGPSHPAVALSPVQARQAPARSLPQHPGPCTLLFPCQGMSGSSGSPSSSCCCLPNPPEPPRFGLPLTRDLHVLQAGLQGCQVRLDHVSIPDIHCRKAELPHQGPDTARPSTPDRLPAPRVTPGSPWVAAPCSAAMHGQGDGCPPCGAQGPSCPHHPAHQHLWDLIQLPGSPGKG